MIFLNKDNIFTHYLFSSKALTALSRGERIFVVNNMYGHEYLGSTFQK